MPLLKLHRWSWDVLTRFKYPDTPAELGILFGATIVSTVEVGAPLLLALVVVANVT